MMAGQKIEISPSALDAALSLLEGEQGRLLALADCLLYHLSPADAVHPSEDTDLHGWRLAQILHDLLGSTETIQAVRSLLQPQP